MQGEKLTPIKESTETTEKVKILNKVDNGEDLNDEEFEIWGEMMEKIDEEKPIEDEIIDELEYLQFRIDQGIEGGEEPEETSETLDEEIKKGEKQEEKTNKEQLKKTRYEIEEAFEEGEKD